jgi:death-on-curing protein
MRYLTLDEILELHRLALEQSGGMAGLRDLYPTLVEKASALAFSLVKNHPFVDGNKRIGHAALETFLVLNGSELCAAVDEQEQVVLGLAAGTVSREDFTEWIRAHLAERSR